MSVQRIRKAVLKHLKIVRVLEERIRSDTFGNRKELESLDRWALMLSQEVKKGDREKIIQYMGMETGLASMDRNLYHSLKEIKRLLPKLINNG